MATITLMVLVVLFIAQGLYRNYGRPTFDALPAHIDQPHEWDGKDDDDHWYTRWIKSVKGWFAFGPLSDYRWARFRDYPMNLLALGGKGAWRYENDITDYAANGLIKQPTWYLSRVQYWKPWHIGLEWPLFLHGHCGNWQAYIGFKRDADRVYWLAVYFGRKWK